MPGSSTRTGTSRPINGIAADTVVVFAVRPGNPKHIKAWHDLIKPGVQVVTPNPFSSGSAKWNILAAYGAERRLGKTDKQATAYVQQLFQHVVSQDTSGRNATNTFLSGKGDVLITYESEALNSRLNGQDIQYVIPRQTMLIELPIAVLKSSSNIDKANQFIQYVKSDPAQESARPVRLPSGRPEDREEVRATSTRRARGCSRSTTSTSGVGATPTRSGSSRTPAGWPRSSRRSEGQRAG